jgi:hypothetical protein
VTTRQLLTIAFAITITFVQEQVLLFIPNVQFTVLLIILFSSIFTFKESIVYVIGYVLLDSLYMGGFNLFYMVPMLLSWALIPMLYHTVLKKTSNEYILGGFAFIFGFVYGWMFIPFNMLQTGIYNVVPYLIADIPFEIIMAVTGFVTVVWLYKPLLVTMQKILYAQRFETSKHLK